MPLPPSRRLLLRTLLLFEEVRSIPRVLFSSTLSLMVQFAELNAEIPETLLLDASFPEILVFPEDEIRIPLPLFETILPVS